LITTRKLWMTNDPKGGVVGLTWLILSTQLWIYKNFASRQPSVVGLCWQHLATMVDVAKCCQQSTTTVTCRSHSAFSFVYSAIGNWACTLLIPH